GPEILGPVGAFAERDQREQVPQPVPVADLQRARPMADEKALVGRLDHVLRVHLTREQLLELSAGQPDQPAGKLFEDLARGGVLAGPQPGHQGGEGVCGGHEPLSGPAGKRRENGGDFFWPAAAAIRIDQLEPGTFVPRTLYGTANATSAQVPRSAPSTCPGGGHFFVCAPAQP